MPLASVNGTEIHFDVHGTGDAVVLIHGLGSSGADWAFQIPALRERFQVIVPDLRGSGLSGRPAGPYSIDGFADDLWVLIDHLGVERCSIVGFSLGGAVALAMALARPQACRQLVMINALPTYRVDHWRKWLEVHLQLTMVRLFGLRRTARMVAARLFPDPHQAPMRRRVEEVVGANARRPYLESVRALAGWCAAARLDELTARSLVLSAEFDYTPLEEKRRWAAAMGATFRVVADSRHGTPFDAILATNRVLAAFLAGEDAPTDGLTRDAPEQVPMVAPEL
ncbi:MAG: alpha/beta hydrolase [Pseudomonadota bacterium]